MCTLNPYHTDYFPDPADDPEGATTCDRCHRIIKLNEQFAHVADNDICEDCKEPWIRDNAEVSELIEYLEHKDLINDFVEWFYEMYLTTIPSKEDADG